MLLMAIGFCQGTAKVWKVVGNILFIFKIIIPVLLIIFGMIDLGKAVIGSKDDEVKKAAKSLLMRSIAALVIFLIPTIVGFIITLVGGFGNDEEMGKDYNYCAACISNPGDPNKCDTSNSK